MCVDVLPTYIYLYVYLYLCVGAMCVLVVAVVSRREHLIS